MTIPYDDRGLTLGDGLFETVLAIDGRLVLWAEHKARLSAGCRLIGLPTPDDVALDEAAEGALARAALLQGRAAVRLTWTAGSGGRGLDRPDGPQPRLFATAAPAPGWASPARVTISSIRRNSGSPAARVKSLSYLDNVLAREEARRGGADEALMLNDRGEVACAAAANLFWTAGGRLFTPAVDCGILAGVIRAEVIRAAEEIGVAVNECAAGPQALREADGLFLTNSLIGLRPVAAIDDHAVEDAPLRARLAARIGA